MPVEDRRLRIASSRRVGSLCALMLGRPGVAVRLFFFDKNDGPKADPRAATPLDRRIFPTVMFTGRSDPGQPVSRQEWSEWKPGSG
jgi:hypothetical protein